MTVDAWAAAKAVIGERRVLAGPQLSQQLLHGDHWVMVGARYRAAAALIGDAQSVLEVGCGESIGAGILARGKRWYHGIDTDREAIQIAERQWCAAETMTFSVSDALAPGPVSRMIDAVVSLDVIEHIPAELEGTFMLTVTQALRAHGVAVIGTPNARFFDLASPQSKAGHVNNYDHARLHALMSKHFRVVVSMGMQDTSVHFGHPDARHYLLFAGYGPKSGPIDQGLTRDHF